MSACDDIQRHRNMVNDSAAPLDGTVMRFTMFLCVQQTADSTVEISHNSQTIFEVTEQKHLLMT